MRIVKRLVGAAIAVTALSLLSLLSLLSVSCADQAGVSGSSRRDDDLSSPFSRLSTPRESSLRADAYSRAVRRGRALLNATPDSLPKNAGNALRCTSCHLDDGSRAFAMPWVGVYARFPQYRSRSGNVDVIEDRINDCFKRSLNGVALDPTGRDMKDIVTYMAWLSRDRPVGLRVRGQGIDSMAPLPTDLARGSTVFATVCARCHASDGQGTTIRSHPSLWGPPLWGPRSFNIGAGMARLRVAAAFIHRHMPKDQLVALTAQQAYDVAAFVNAHSRPDFAGKENDWPGGDPPPDVAYSTAKKRSEVRQE